MLNICLIGAGRIGKVHAMAIEKVSGARISHVVDPFPEGAKVVAAQYGAQFVSEDEAFASGEVDAFIIASSTDTHSPLLARCATVGKPVFCEKPIDLDYDKAAECVKQVNESGITCMLGFNRRFDPQFAQLKAQMDAGAIGQLETLIITSRDPSPPPAEYIAVSGGLFRDMMIHDFDMARWVLGEEPTRIYATGSVLVDPAIGEAGDVDTASVTLSTASGAIAIITNSRRASYGYDQRVEAFGEKGMLQVNNQLENQVVFSGGNGVSGAKPQHFFLERYADAYRIELTRFVESLQNNTPPPATADDGLKALALADAAVKSLQTGFPVDL
uniref:Myo-inositol 2-dehydrogenase (EC) n=1 Tax=uncultured Thiotrichaceae bacterium TaxID=298394 RepID=A0A6S6U4T6_9GAMM|nr:MAG: Myo-inositol 2-dehydrogenase (EC [uncultured Thiotrichaceae bacterium]